MSTPVGIRYPVVVAIHSQRRRRSDTSLRLREQYTLWRRVLCGFPNSANDLVMAHVLHQFHQHTLLAILGMHKGHQRVVDTGAWLLVNQLDTARAQFIQ